MTHREWVGFNRSQVESILSCLEDLCLAKHKKARPPDAPTTSTRVACASANDDATTVGRTVFQRHRTLYHLRMTYFEL
jgi:hypothetical protein